MAKTGSPCQISLSIFFSNYLWSITELSKTWPLTSKVEFYQSSFFKIKWVWLVGFCIYLYQVLQYYLTKTLVTPIINTLLIFVLFIILRSLWTFSFLFSNIKAKKYLLKSKSNLNLCNFIQKDSSKRELQFYVAGRRYIEHS